MTKGFVKLNLNVRVKVKLLPEGMIHLLENHKRITGSYGEYVPRLDKDGYYSTQLWSLMQEFGDVMSITTGHRWFVNDVVIECNPEDWKES